MYLVVVNYYKATVVNILNLRLRFLIYRLISLVLLRRFDFLALFSSNIYYNNAAFRRHVLILALTNIAGFIVVKLIILSMNSIADL